MSGEPGQTKGALKSWREQKWRRARLYRLGFERFEYDKYLETPHWQAFRKHALETQKQRLGRNCCERCPEEKRQGDVELHVHHLTYERLGEELIEDVEIICRACHEKEHGHDTDKRARHYGPDYR